MDQATEATPPQQTPTLLLFQNTKQARSSGRIRWPELAPVTSLIGEAFFHWRGIVGGPSLLCLFPFFAVPLLLL
jgi:hypothetical protein